MGSDLYQFLVIAYLFTLLFSVSVIILCLCSAYKLSR